MKLGVLKRLKFGMMLFGIGMGLIFPLYAIFFVEFKPGLQIWFNLGCIIAGIMVGGFSYLLVKWILLGHLRELALACRRISNGQFDVHIDLDSPDEVGEIVHGFNMMSETLGELFDEVSVGVQNLTGVAGNLSAFSHELVQTIGEQRAHVANISTATHEATATIDEISGNLSQTAGFSAKINDHAGLTDEQLAHKVVVINRALTVNQPDPAQPLEVLAKVGGFEIGGLVGVMLGAAAHRIPVVIDGFISGAAALIGTALVPGLKDFIIPAHVSAEAGHRGLLEYLGLKPLLDLGLRLGEGTGAALGIFLAETAARVMAEMATFAEAGVSEGD